MSTLLIKIGLSSAVFFTVALVVCALLASSRSPLKIIDTPNERSLHDKPTPRTGGIGILLSLLLFGFWATSTGSVQTSIIYEIAGLLLLVAIASFIDDLVNLSSIIRLLIHCFVAYMIVCQVFACPHFWWLRIFYCLAVVWAINLYNFMDGIDGLAGGMGVFGFGIMGLAGLQAGAVDFAHLSFVVAAANLGFLFWNFPPSRIFMGDVGSAAMGFWAAALSLWGTRDNIFPVWFPILVFSPFIWDSTFTLIRRALAGEKFWQAHRSHIYQKLVQMGWGHKKTVLAEYALMIMVGCAALLTIELELKFQILVLACFAGLYICLSFFVSRLLNQLTL